jgi:ankyrin repeat protein
LHLATNYGHKAVVELLLANKADINAKTNEGLMPLERACQEGSYKDVVELLLANKPEVNAKRNDGMTSLYIATMNGYKDVVELLRQNGGHE